MIHRFTAHRPAGRLAGLLLAGAVAGCGSTTPSDTVAAPAAPVAPAQPDVPQLIVSDLSPGTGSEAQAGNLVTVHYTGWLYDPRMRVGGQRRLVIPSTLGYGQRGAADVIPPGAALVFDVELLDVRAGAG
jgi:hypothetical protein